MLLKRRKLLTSGTNNFIIRKATTKDLTEIKNIADAYRKELGFVLRPAITRSITNNEVFIAEIEERIKGFIEYHHRQDNQTTLYNIAVSEENIGKGIGRALIETLYHEAEILGKLFILLKCPIDLPSINFYKHLGFELLYFEKGKKRALAIFSLSIT
jgi:N-acetylglutamate synthase-like GNAT family acetyltransferase